MFERILLAAAAAAAAVRAAVGSAVGSVDGFVVQRAVGFADRTAVGFDRC